MALGDVISFIGSVTAAGSVVAQPPAGTEWVIHNIWHADDLFPRFVSSGGFFFIASIAPFLGANVETNLQFHLTNSVYLAFGANSAQQFGYDGIVTK